MLMQDAHRDAYFASGSQRWAIGQLAGLSANTDSSCWHTTLPAGAVQPMPGMSRAPMASWPETGSQLCPGFCAPHRRSPATAQSAQAQQAASLDTCARLHGCRSTPRSQECP